MSEIRCYILKNQSPGRTMGCTSSVSAIGKRKRLSRKYSVSVPVLRIPVQSDLRRTLRGLVPNDLADRIASLRNQILLVAEDTGGSAVSELIKALEEYLSLLIGLTKLEYELQELLEFRWKEIGNGKQANEKLIPKESSLSERLVSADCKRDAVDLLLKAAGYFSFCIRDVLLRLPPDIKSMLPSDMNGNVLEAISLQALAQGTEVQLGLAVQSQNATLSVKRRLACEQLSFFDQLSLKPDDYEFPELDPAWGCGKWEIPGQTLEQHLNDGGDDEPET